ncbi:hypothetical protein B0H19DRAFT_1060023 [Mycena capillaripes]|nr:hypothetical protein B0H19DRAFT_1060023 [Mycena capillaripes]
MLDGKEQLIVTWRTQFRRRRQPNNVNLFVGCGPQTQHRSCNGNIHDRSLSGRNLRDLVKAQQRIQVQSDGGSRSVWVNYFGAGGFRASNASERKAEEKKLLESGVFAGYWRKAGKLGRALLNLKFPVHVLGVIHEGMWDLAGGRDEQQEVDIQSRVGSSLMGLMNL